MAVTTYGANDPLAVTLWSKRLAVEVLKQTLLHKFMGEESSNITQIKDETRKSAGDKVTYGLRMQLTGLGVVGDGALAGNQESLTTFSDAVVINQPRHAVRSAGRMSKQGSLQKTDNKARLENFQLLESTTSLQRKRAKVSYLRNHSKPFIFTTCILSA